MAWTERFVDASAVGGGTGTSAADPWTFAEAVSNSAAGMRVNFKAGTYTYTTNYTTSFSGTVTQSIWWRGYKTTIGDLDNKLTSDLTDSTDMPLFETNGNYFFFSTAANYVHTSGLSWKQNATSRPAIYDRRTRSFAKNCRYRIATTSATAQSVVYHEQTDSQRFINCEFICDSTNHTGYHAYMRGDGAFFGCRFKGQGSGTGVVGVYAQNIQNCIFSGLNVAVRANDRYQIVNNVFYDIADDAIQQTSTNASANNIVGNVFHSVTGYCIGSTVGAISGNLIANNRYYNCSNIFENVYEDLQFDEATESSDPFVNAAAEDFTLNSSASSYGAGYGLMIGTSSTDYSDIGAIQHADPSGGGGSTFHPLG
jgi:hypothetical protein